MSCNEVFDIKRVIEEQRALSNVAGARMGALKNFRDEASPMPATCREDLLQVQKKEFRNGS